MRFFVLVLAIVAILGSCRTRPDHASETRSIHSTIETNEPAVLKLLRYGWRDDSIVYWGCTITAYNDDHGLTAAHCVVKGDDERPANPNDLKVAFPNTREIAAIGVFVHPGYAVKKDSSVRVDRGNDLAIVRFPPGTFKHTKKMASDAPVIKTEDIKMIGFGMRGYYNRGTARLVTEKDRGKPEKDLLESMKRYDKEMAEKIDAVHAAYHSRSANSTVDGFKEAQRFKQHQRKIQKASRRADGSFIARSGKTVLNHISGGAAGTLQGIYLPVRGDDFLVFSGAFLDTTFKDEIDRFLFKAFGMYAPDENTDPNISKGNIAGIYGDSGGPVLDEDGHLAGVASYIISVTDYKKIHTSYVNVNSKKSKKFFKEAQAKGFELPVVAAAPRPTPTPGASAPNPTPTPFTGVPVNNDLFVALANAQPNAAGQYHMIASASAGIGQVWTCVGTDSLEACKDVGAATDVFAASTIGPAGRANFKTLGPLDIGSAATGVQPFALMASDQKGRVSGVIVYATR